MKNLPFLLLFFYFWCREPRASRMSGSLFTTSTVALPCMWLNAVSHTEIDAPSIVAAQGMWFFFFFFFFFSLLLFVSMVFFRADELNAPEMNWHTQWQSAVRTSVQSKFLRTPISRSSALKKKKKITLFLQPARLARSHCGDVPSCGIRYVTLVCCEIKSLIASRRSLLSSRSKRFVSSPHDEISSLIPRSCTRLALCSFDFVAAMRHSLAPGPERCDFLICVTFFFFFFYKGFSPFFFFFFFFFFAYRNRRPRV
jgi:hypothetical protein